jgi:DNA topoisomerase-1
MERTNIRIGNRIYKKMNGSVGMSTLNDKHVKINGNSVRFTFKGKKGISHDITLNNRKFAELVKKCRDIPGQDLFQYYDEQGNHHKVDSGMVNEYIRNISGGDFTAKDFRTWGGSVNAILAFKEAGFFDSAAEIKKTIVEVLDKVSQKLGNTRMVCRKYYVHPVILSLYENKGLRKYVDELDEIEVDDDISGLTAAEKILLKLLETN